MDIDNRVVTLVSSDAAFGDEITLVYRGYDLEETLESDDQANGFISCLELMSIDYLKTTIGAENDDTTVNQWGSNVSTKLLDNLLNSAENASLSITTVDRTVAARAKLPTASYFGFDPSMSDFLSHPEFAKILERNGFILTDGKGQSLDYSQVDTSRIWIYDQNSETGLAVLHEGLVEVEITSDGFRDILQLMDEYVQKNQNKRLILGIDRTGLSEIDAGHPMYSWTFDYEMGRYEEP